MKGDDFSARNGVEMRNHLRTMPRDQLLKRAVRMHLLIENLWCASMAWPLADKPAQRAKELWQEFRPKMLRELFGRQRRTKGAA